LAKQIKRARASIKAAAPLLHSLSPTNFHSAISHPRQSQMSFFSVLECACMMLDRPDFAFEKLALDITNVASIS
jgi:hypothetical protein